MNAESVSFENIIGIIIISILIKCILKSYKVLNKDSQLVNVFYFSHLVEKQVIVLSLLLATGCPKKLEGTLLPTDFRVPI